MVTRKFEYGDNTGRIWTDYIRGRHWVSAELTVSTRPSTLRYWDTLFSSLVHQLKKDGINELYAVVSDIERYRFAEHFGFKATGEYLVDHPHVEIVRKEL